MVDSKSLSVFEAHRLIMGSCSKIFNFSFGDYQNSWLPLKNYWFQSHHALPRECL